MRLINVFAKEGLIEASVPFLKLGLAHLCFALLSQMIRCLRCWQLRTRSRTFQVHPGRRIPLHLAVAAAPSHPVALAWKGSSYLHYFTSMWAQRQHRVLSVYIESNANGALCMYVASEHTLSERVE